MCLELVRADAVRWLEGYRIIVPEARMKLHETQVTIANIQQ
jgi:hypothetical protein